MSFDRIVRQPMVNGGLACIRDTGVTVSEVVQLALSGHDQAEILMKYPQLDTQDIHQALAYSISDTLNTLVYWKHEGIKYLSTARGYSEMLADQAPFINADEISEEERKEWLMQVFNYSRIAISQWQQLRDATFRRYSRETLHLKATPVTELAEKLATALEEETPNVKGQIITEDDLPAIPVDDYLMRALVNLMAGEANSFEPESEIRIFAHGSGVAFRVKRHIKYAYDEDKLFAPGRAFATADVIIHQYGGALQVDVQDREVTLIFALDIID